MSILRKLVFLPDREPEPKPDMTNEQPPLHKQAAVALARCFIILLDFSGSMFTKDFPPSRIKAACGAVVQVVNYLLARSPDSLIGIGTFSDSFHQCTPPRKVGERSQAILASLNDLGETGSTNLTAGLNGILDMVKTGLVNKVPVVALILTDGHHNVGRKSMAVAAADTLKELGVDIWAVGIGGHPSAVDEDLLQKVVSRPEGYIFIGNWEGPQAIVDQFRRIAGLYFLEDDKHGEE